MDIAGAYADPRVYSAVKAKWDSMPANKDKKGGKGKGSPKAKRPTTGGSGVSYSYTTSKFEIILWLMKLTMINKARN